MKNHIVLLLGMCLLSVSSCKKEATTPATTPAVTSPYYFKFTFGGDSYNFNANFPQYKPFYANEIGGYQVATTSLYTSVGLGISWPANDTVRESDIMGLKGRTLYFNDSIIKLDLSFEKDASSTTWRSEDTANTNYNIKITNVTFLKKDTTLGNPLRTYIITGTCNAVMSQGSSTGIFSGGQFNFVISRMDL